MACYSLDRTHSYSAPCGVPDPQKFGSFCTQISVPRLLKCTVKNRMLKGERAPPTEIAAIRTVTSLTPLRLIHKTFSLHTDLRKGTTAEQWKRLPCDVDPSNPFASAQGEEGDGEGPKPERSLAPP